MGRKRRQPPAAGALKPSSSQLMGSDPAADPVTAREYYARRYKNAKKKCKTLQLYAKSTDGAINRIESFWREFVSGH